MSNINITQNKNTVTVNGETRVVTVKTAGPQGTFTDGNLGDVTVSSNGTNIVVNSGAINNAKVASNAAIAGTKISPDFGSQNITTTGNLTLSSTSPSILLTEGDANPDYIIKSQGGIFKVRDQTNGVDRISVNTDGHVDVAGNLDVGAGVDITGDLTVSGNMTVSGTTTTIDTTTLTVEDKNIELGKVSTPTDTTADGGGITLKGATDKTFNWIDATDSWTSSEHIALPDNKKLQLGASQDLQISHNSASSKNFISTIGNNDLIITGRRTDIKNDTNNETLASFIRNEDVELYYDNVKRLETQTNGTRIYDSLGIGADSTTTALLNLRTPDGSSGNNTTKKGIIIRDGAFSDGELIDCRDSAGNTFFSVDGSLNVNLADNHRLQLGDSQDFDLYHTGTDSIINNNTNILRVRSNHLLLSETDNRRYLQGNSGVVELFYDNNKKFETTSTGITASGTQHLFTSGTSGNCELIIQADSDNNNENDNPKLIFRQDGSLNLSAIGHNFTGSDASGNKLFIANCVSFGGIEFYTGDTADNYTNGVKRLEITADGNVQIPDNGKLQLGASQDLELFHDGSHSRIKDVGTGNLFIHATNFGILNAANTKNYLIASDGGALSIYYDGSKKLETTSTGVTVTGVGSIDNSSSTAGIGLEIKNSSTSAFSTSENLEGTTNGKLTPLVLRNLGNAPNAETYLGFDAGASSKAQWNLGIRKTSALSGDFIFNTRTGSSTSAERLRITSNGNVGIGTTSPSSPLSIKGNGQLISLIKSANTNNNGILFQDSTPSNKAAIWHYGSDDALVFWSGGSSERMRIDSSGNVGIGKTNPSTKLDVDGDATINSITVGKGANSVTGNTVLGENALDAAVTGGLNTAIGNTALTANTSGVQNTAVGALAMDANTTGSYNSALGLSALGSNTSGSYNTATGHNSLALNTTGSFNTAMGVDALNANTTGTENTAVGRLSLAANTTGVKNTAVGKEALDTNTTGGSNTAVGYKALTANTTASNNVAVGLNSMLSNTTGTDNTAVGTQALDANTTASNNTAVGRRSLTTNTTGSENTAVGVDSLRFQTTGTSNTAIGYTSLNGNTTGSSNTGVGQSTLKVNTSGDNNTAVGRNSLAANTTGTSNVAVGAYALDANTTANSNTAVGYAALGAANTGANNTAIGDSALTSLTSATSNVAVGHDALRTNTTGNTQVAIGDSALYSNSTGLDNVAIGAFCLYSNSTASNNVGVGRRVLFANTTGTSNVAMGYGALDANTTANNNTAIGHNSLTANTTGQNNTAVGRLALALNTTASDNASLGSQALNLNTTGASNVAVGRLALYANTTASNNTAVGKSALQSNTTGNHNVALGTNALESNTTANNNVAIGSRSLQDNTTGYRNIGIGRSALESNTTADDNVAVGNQALQSNTTGASNVAVGANSLDACTTGFNNVGVGTNALGAVTTGNMNTAVGNNCADAITTGLSNVAIGQSALGKTTTGDHNTAVGTSALQENTTASDNTGIGRSALLANTTGSDNTAIGRLALSANTTGSGNTVLGFKAGDNITTGDNNIVIGNDVDASSATVDNEITLGNSSIATLRCNTQTISSLSDARDKTNVIDLPEGLDFVTNLRPVKFEWATRDGNGKDGSFEHGFIAQDLQTAQKENNADYLNMVMDENPDRLEASYGKLVPILVKAIQELTIEVNKLKSNG